MRDPLPRAFFFFFFQRQGGDLVVDEVGKRKSGLLELDVPCHLLHT